MPFTFKASDKALEPANTIRSKGGESSAKIIARSEQKLNPNKYRVKNGFVGTVVEAYSKHNHLIIRPDDVWLAIMTQFSAYVEGNAETLRDRFVEHKEKKELVVKSNSTISTTDYPKLCKLMTEQIGASIKDPSVKDWVLPDFSTTTQTDKVVGAVVLMSSMKSYFSYKFELCCGLPKITLEGVEEDWVHLQDKAKRLLEFDNSPMEFLGASLNSSLISSLLGFEKGHMAKWYKMLAPILQHFTDSVRGKPDIDWWSRVCTKIGNGSGPRWLSGWITTFCVFNDSGKWVGDDFAKESYSETSINPNKNCGYSEEGWPIINCNAIPKGFVQVSLVIDDNGVVYNTELLAGHMSTYLQDVYSIRPHVEWLIRVKPELKIKPSRSELEKLSRQELVDYAVKEGFTRNNILTSESIIRNLITPDPFSQPEDTVCYD